jgi:hypothetical protein
LREKFPAAQWDALKECWYLPDVNRPLKMEFGARINRRANAEKNLSSPRSGEACATPTRAVPHATVSNIRLTAKLIHKLIHFKQIYSVFSGKTK